MCSTHVETQGLFPLIGESLFQNSRFTTICLIMLVVIVWGISWLFAGLRIVRGFIFSLDLCRS
ncbi:hypothetical protein D3C75_1243000 [compost metagenome]